MQYRLELFSFLFLSALLGLAGCSGGNGDHEEAHSEDQKPVQHLQLDDITSSEEAATVFAEETAFIRGQSGQLSPEAMHEIHMSTYSLEKAVAYYVENLEGPEQELAERIAVVVEDIHLASEKNDGEAMETYIDQLESLAGDFRPNP